MPTDILALPPSSLNTKWKEPYASASLNQRFVGITAPGIYRGLRLQPDPSLGDRTIQVEADPDKLDHVAVYENASGFSVTYRDSTSGNITLSLAGYASVDVVVCIFVDYQTGVSTTGAFRIFTVAEFNALLPAVTNALVILGTVTVPALGVITSSNISLLRRTLASTNLARGTIANAPVVRNPDFESGEINATYARSSLFWDKSTTVGTGTWKTSTTQVLTGMKSIELNVTAGPVTGELSQQMGVETAEGELFIISIIVKQLKTISSGTLVMFMEWSDVNDALLTTTTLSLDGGAIDASFRTIETIIPAPAGASSLRAVGVRATALSPSSVGVFGYIDSVNVFIEARDPQYPYPFDQAFRRPAAATSLLLTNKDGNFGAQAPLMRFDQSTPSGEGQVFLETLNPASVAYALSFLGRLRQIGSGQLASEAAALKARVEAPYGIVAGVDYTLMWESAPISGSTGTTRWYITPSGSMVWTTNAKWGSPVANQWNKDIVGVVATKFEVSSGTQAWQLRAAATGGSWLDASWEAQQIFRPVSDASPVPIHEVRDASNVLRYAMSPAIAGSVEPTFQILDSAGNRRSVIDHLGFPTSRIVTRTFFWEESSATEERGWDYLASGTSSSILTGNVSPKRFACGNSIFLNPGSTNGGIARAFYVPFTEPFNNSSLINMMLTVSWSVYVSDRTGCFMGFGINSGFTFTQSNDWVAITAAAADANWQAETEENLAATGPSFNIGDKTNTGVPVTNATGYEMRVEYQGTGYPGGYATRFFINDALVATHTNLTNRPNTSLGLILLALGTAVRTANTCCLVGPLTMSYSVPDNLTNRKV